MTEPSENPSVPEQPKPKPEMAKYAPILYGSGAILLLLTGSSVYNAVMGHKQVSTGHSVMSQRPSTATPQAVSSYSTEQQQQAQKDVQEAKRKQEFAAAMSQEGAYLPGPEADSVPAMTPAQQNAIYGGSPNASKHTSNISQARAEAKQRALAKEKRRQDALNSDTVAIDFSGSGSASGKSASAPALTPTNDVPAERQQDQAQAQMQNASASSSTAQKNPMAPYPFDDYQGQLYRVFEGTVLEGVVTNHIDGALSGPILVMLTTDYYSHDHQQLLLPQGTRLIGNVQSVGSAGQRKLFVVFNRAVCPDGFSLDLNRFIALDQVGTTGLATDVNNHYLSSFAAAAAIGGIGGLAQINNGSVLDTSSQLRNGITQQTGQESEQVLQRFLTRLPILTVKEGSRARVYINHDILVPSYAEHAVNPTL